MCRSSFSLMPKLDRMQYYHDRSGWQNGIISSYSGELGGNPEKNFDVCYAVWLELAYPVRWTP